MKKVSTFDLRPGMIIGENVLSYDRQIILAKGTRLNDSLITKLELHGILTVQVDEGEEERREEAAAVGELPAGTTTYAERVVSSPEFKEFKKDYDSSTRNLKFALSEMVEKNAPIDPQVLIKEPLEMVQKLSSPISIMDMLHNMRDYDDSTFTHCINVGLLNYLAAGWLHWSKADQEMAMACGLLHDIGKLKVSHDILTKPGKLNPAEYEHIKKHTILGYRTLLASNADDHICMSALMHHERNDGTGYPLHLTGDKVDEFAKLTAVSDVYDAMTAARVYRGPLCPFRVIEIFEEEGFERYETEYVMTFLRNVGNTYIRNGCRLSDGRLGEVIMLNNTKLSRPVVMCGNQYINLVDYPGLSIDAIL